jgi:hypothetical protein
MRSVTVFTALFLLPGSHAGADTITDQLSLVVGPTTVEIDPRPPGPRLIRLPDLALTMRLSAECSADMRAESASIGISDTRYSLGPELLADTAGANLTINIPHRQLAPLTIENFCLSGATVSDNSELYIADALSAQISLLCVAENQQSIVYQAVPLGIELRCKGRLDD